MGKKQDKPDFLDLVTFGIFLILVGVMFIITPNLLNKVYTFFRDLEFQHLSSYIYLPAPRSDHSNLFTTLSHFSFYFAVLHLPILLARFIFKSPANKTAGTISGLIIWFGASWIINQFISADILWFTFLGYLITIIGVGVVVQNVIILGSQALKS